MTSRIILAGGACAFTLLALLCIPRHLPSSVLAPSLVPASFHARLEGHRLTLRGSLPDAASHDHILAEARSLYDRSDLRIVDELTVDSQIARAEWLNLLPSILPVFGEMNGRGSVMIDGRFLVLTGHVPTTRAKETILRTASQMTSIGIELEDHLLADQPATAQPTLQTKLNEILSRNPIEFESNHTAITSLGRTALDRLIPVLRQFPHASIEIGGHTDGYGAPEYNRELSRQRAETVRQYLINHGLPQRFTAIGYGDSQPLSTQRNRAALRRNRRIEMHVQNEGAL